MNIAAASAIINNPAMTRTIEIIRIDGFMIDYQ
jgi:hypothetical protein